jgi:hypothetical protein
MTIPYHNVLQTPNDESTGTTDWVASTGFGYVAVGTDDSAYIYTSIADTEHYFRFVDHTLESGMCCVGIEFFAIHNGGELQLMIDRRGEEGLQLSHFPRRSNFEASEEFRYDSVFLPMRPFDTILSSDSSWGKTGIVSLSDYYWGVKSKQNTLTKVDQLGIKVYVRAKADIEELIKNGTYSSFQLMETEGIRYCPVSDRFSDNEPRDYFVGYDRIPIYSSMKTVSTIRSGRINDETGYLEQPGCSIDLIDIDTTVIDGTTNYYKNGFYSWLFSFGDLTNFDSTYMADSISSGYNTINGLNPKDEANSYGEMFSVEDADSIPTAGTIDSYVYVGRETIWAGSKDNVEDTVGTGGSPLLLGRGMFGSTNSPHLVNKYTGVYPLVRSHPGSWRNRWFKVWTFVRDPLTGFPMPVEFAFARTYTIGAISQSLATDSNSFSIDGTPYYKRLEKSMLNATSAELKGIYLPLSEVIVEYKDSGVFVEKALIPSNWFETLNDVIAEVNRQIDNDFSSLGISFGLSATASGAGGCAFVAKGSINLANSINLTISPGLAEVIGFDNKGLSKKPPDVSYNGKYIWQGTNNSKHAYVDNHGIEITVNGDDDELWDVNGTQINMPNGGFFHSCLSVRWGKEERFYKVLSGPTVRAQAKTATPPRREASTYYTVWYGDAFMRSIDISETKNPSARCGDPPPKVYPGVVYDGVIASELLKAVLTSTGFGTNGEFDVLPIGTGLGIREDMIDMQSLDLAESILGRFGRRYGFIRDEKNAKEIIDAEMNLPANFFLSENSNGQISIAVPSIPSNTLAAFVPSISDSDIIFNSALNQVFNAEGIINKITLKIDYDFRDNEFATTIIAVEPNSVQAFGEKALEVEHKGLRSTGITDKGYSTASVHSGFASLCRSIFDRRAWESPKVTIKTSPSVVERKAADPVILTIGNMLDHTNSTANGLSAIGAEVINCERSEIDGRCVITLARDYQKKNYAGWAPSLWVESWNTTSNTATVSTDKFSFSSPPDYMPWLKDNDLEYFSVGDEILMVERNDSTPDIARLSITSIDISNSTVTMNATASSVFSNSVIVFSEYPNCTQDQLDNSFCVIAFDNGYIDTNIEAFSYRS